MRYLVTGAGGFIGGQVMSDLQATGHGVVGFGRTGVECCGDIRREKDLEPAMVGVDGVFHFAAHIGKDQSETYYDVNVGGTRNVLELAVKHGVKRVLFASTSGVYGNNPQLPLTVESGTFPISDYAKSKLQAEALGRNYEVDFVVVRYFNVWGGSRCIVSRFRNQLVKGKPITVYGDGSQTRDFVHVEEVSDFSIRAMHEAPKGYSIYNCCSGKETSIRELVDGLAEELGVEPKFKFEPLPEGSIVRSWGSSSKIRQKCK